MALNVINNCITLPIMQFAIRHGGSSCDIPAKKISFKLLLQIRGCVQVQGCWGCEVVTEAIQCDEFMTGSFLQEGYEQQSWRKVMFRDFYMQWLRMILTTGDTSQVSLVVVLSIVWL
jgi:hypothetical protein